MSTLIIPDVHEQIDKLEDIEARLAPKAARIVMLGDFFDSFGERHSARIATWLRNHLTDPAYAKWEILWGNHDVSYAFGGRFRCSGYDWHTQDATNRIERAAWMKMKVFTKVGKFLVSHAGFHPSTIHLATDDLAEAAIVAGFTGVQDPMWAAGQNRGGTAPIGGPVWLDWNYEFKPFDIPQIVGHTYQKGKPRIKTYPSGGAGEPSPDPAISYCLDNGLNTVAWVDEATDSITFEDL